MNVNFAKSVDPEKLIPIEGEILKTMQDTILSIMDDIADVCEENHINYTLGGGSALGAVRHKGFIPWDDDMDMNMFRMDYERFIPLFRAKYGDKYWIHTPEQTHNFGMGLVHIRKKDTIVRVLEDFQTDECGAYVDLFIIENTFDNTVLRHLHGIASLGMEFGTSCRRTFRDRKYLKPLVAGQNRAEKLYRLKVFCGFFAALFTLDAWTHGMNRINAMRKNKPGRYVTIPIGRKHFFGEMYERDMYEPTELVPFAGREYRLLKNADAYLKNLYGDYMQVPPPEKREHHSVVELKL